MSAAPSSPRIGKVSLIVHDLGLVADFYQKAVGLHLLSSDGEAATLGVGNAVLLELRQDKAARRRSSREAGLFHTAFLLPSRGDLGRWTKNAAATRAPVVGASDHLVSEAIYLTDPEGNGVEIYSDRPHDEWKWDGSTIRMATNALDVNAIVAAAGPNPPDWTGAPAKLRIGHVHLRVGDATAAEAWWGAEVGLQPTTHYPGATFLASGGYHHHIAGNVWQSRGAGARNPARSGLDFVTLSGSGVTSERELADPWGTIIRMAPGL